MTELLSTAQPGLFDLPVRQNELVNDSVQQRTIKKRPRQENTAKNNSTQPSKQTSARQITIPENRGQKPQLPRATSGLVPVGDVRLTANIKAEIHLKLKIISAHRRTTIGELIEELVENHLESPYGIKK